MTEPSSDLNNEDIDRLFREAAGNYTPLQDAQSWQDMERKLDAGSGQKDHKRGILWFTALILLALLAGGIYFYLAGHPQSAILTSDSSGTTRTVSPSAHPSAGYQAATTSQTSNPVSIAALSEVTGHPPLPQPHQSHTYNSGQSYTVLLPPAGLISAGVGDSGGSDQGISRLSASTGPGTSLGSLEKIPAYDLPMNFLIDDRFLKDGIASIAAVRETESTRISGRPSKSQAAGPNWQMSLVLGPDLAIVNPSLWSSPGLDAGLLFGYQLSSKWKLESGLLYATKIYKALPSEYNPKAYVYQSPNLQQIDANCRVFDLPINIRYNVFTGKTGSFFAETGLSSYWMARENYTFQYDAAGIRTSDTWGISNQNRHILSILNLSAGYEYRVSKRFSWQLEPFVKLPLSGIGYGRVKLVSTGVFFSLNYGL